MFSGVRDLMSEPYFSHQEEWQHPTSDGTGSDLITCAVEGGLVSIGAFMEKPVMRRLPPMV